MSQPGYCSLCFTHVQSRLQFPAHALICAGKKREMREPDYEEVRVMILDDQVDDVRALLENHAVDKTLISIYFARSIEMCRLLLEFGAERFEYVLDGKVALEEAAKYFNIREFLPRYPGIADGFVEKLVALRDAHYALRDVDPSEPFRIHMNLVSDRWPEAGQFSTTYDWDDAYDVPRPDWTYKREFLYEMVFNGFFPVEAGDRLLEDLYFQRYSDSALSFWKRLPGGPWTFLKGMWITSTLNAVVQGVSQSPASFKLMIAGQYHLIFKKSTRAKTDMSLFRTMDSKNIAHPEANMVPVTRYATGMSRGLYFNEDSVEDDEDSKEPREKTEYCGTFYYHEPESNAYLKYNRALVAKDKSEASDILRHGVGGRRRYLNTLKDLVLRSIEKDPEQNLMFTPSEFWSYIRRLMKDETLGERVVGIQLSKTVEAMMKAVDNPDLRHDDRRYYCGHVLDVYAMEDVLDQPVCEEARKQGYDIVILERMVGSRQIVTEVLDVRPREESFKNLYFLEQNPN